VPGIDQFRLFQAYQQKGVPIETRINYLAGHWGYSCDVMTEALKKISNEIVNRTPAATLIRNKAITPYYVPENGSNPIPLNITRAPFTLEMPRYFHDDTNVYLIATGNANSLYRLTFLDESYQKIIVDVTLDARGTWGILIPSTALTSNRYTLDNILALNANRQPYEILTTLRTSLPMDGKLVMERFTGNLRQASGGRFEKIVMAGYMGNNNETALRIGSTIADVSYGIMEKIGEGKPYTGL
jgi:hypothetical protein